MSSQPSAKRVIRFGLFEVDLSAGELRKQDRNIKLQDQPFQVLALLLSRPGDLVTREELQRELWPADTFVEFDQGLNTAIKKIRVALGDSADNPRFVETIPRKGYRFIAPVDGQAAAAVAVPAVVPVAAPRPRARLLFAASLLGAMVVAGAGVWLLRTNQTSGQAFVPAPLTSYPGDEVSPSLSPDGNHVVFAWNRSESMGPSKFDIYIKLIGGGDPVRLTNDAADEYSPVWSPDGRFVAFLRTLSSSASGVFLIPAIGGVERKLGEIYQDTRNSAYFGPYLGWSPDGKWLFTGDRESDKAPIALFRLSTETGEKQRLISRSAESSGADGFSDSNPAVSPDGEALVFQRCKAAGVCNLFLAELSKDVSVVSEPKQLTFDTRASNPAWTPEGRAIIFSAGAVHAPSLWKAALSQPGWRAGKPERLAFAGDGAAEPTVSRQGRLVYGHTSFDVDIWRAELNNGRPAKPPVKFISSTRVDHEPRYSPDGKRVAFCSNRTGSLELWVCHSDGTNAEQLTSFGGSSYTAGPRWSPDGQWIVFSSTVQGKVQVYVIRSEGGRAKALDVEEQDNWSQDGKWMYAGSKRSGDRQLWKIPWPPTGQERGAIQVTKNGYAGQAVESRDGKYVYYGHNDGVWRVPIEGGEEIQVLKSVLNDNFAVVPKGIYFIPNSLPYAVRFREFSSGKEVVIATLPHEPAWGFSVSPDGRWLAYSEYEAVRGDLMLVEGFR